MARLSFLAIAALVVQAVSAYRPGDESCVVTPTNDCSLSKIKPSALDGSTLVYPGGKTRCAFNDWSSPKNTYTTNSTYFFQVFPAPKKSKKLLLYLDGGGACWDAVSCSFAFICASGFETFYANPRALSVGFMNRTDPTNLFNDWNIVNVPYCTGDVFIGDRVLDGADPAIVGAVFQKPECLNQNQSVHFNGFVNAESAFDWAVKNFPDVDQIALTGSSAGAIAIQLYAKRIAEKWQVEQKKTKFSVLVDSFIGVFPDETPLGSLFNYLGTCSLPWGLPDSAVQTCKSGKGTNLDFFKPTIQATSYADWFFADSTADETQRLYYELLRQGILAYPFQTIISPEELHTKQTQIYNTYKDVAPKLSRFVEVSDRHVFFKTNDWVDIIGEDNKTTLGSVVGGIINQKPTDVPKPTSVTPTCKDASA